MQLINLGLSNISKSHDNDAWQINIIKKKIYF